ncbi:MAG TPA: serine/threonine-protein kinase [Rudaea sp.]|nr:serine/threonine-protein kinase [Rudaea sp.]
MPIDPNFLQPGGAFASPVFQRAIERFEIKECEPGTRIGPYRVVRPLGSGGMGVVYVAERADGEFEQTVALKLVRPDSNSPLAQDLLRRERQILAKLEHPGIARLIDGGRTTDGAFWFALEFVDGVRIDEYCESHSLSLTARLRLFAQVCGIVQFAHGRLLVHRDIKPANILVTNEGAIRLLDFGIAALLTQESNAAAVMQASTPGYASPEQQRGEPITTASDIYQLGVLLKRLVGDAPPAPLAAVIAKATASSTPDRYSTAEELSADVMRVVDHRPVHAYGGGAGYRAALYVRRHRWALAAAAIVAIVFLVMVLHFTLRIRAERDAARAQAERATQVSQFLVDMFSVADPDVNRGDKLTATEILDRGAKKLDDSLASQPTLRANLAETIGRVYMNLGDFPRAEPLLKQAALLKKDDVSIAPTERAKTIGMYAFVEQKLSKLPEAARLIGEADAILQREQSNDAKAQRAALLDQRGLVLKHQGDLAASLASSREAVGLAKESGDARRLATVENHLGLLLYTMDRFTEAQAVYEDALDTDRELFGESHEMTIDAEENLALTLSAQRKFDAALDLMQRSLANETKLLGEDSSETAAGLQMLADIYMDADRPNDALPLYSKALDVTRKSLGARNGRVASVLGDIAATNARLKQYDKAKAAFVDSIAMRREFESQENFEIANAEMQLAFVEFNLGDVTSAENLGTQALAKLRGDLGETHAYVVDAKAMLGQILAAEHKNDQARPLLEQAMESYRDKHQLDADEARDAARALATLTPVSVSN